MLEMSKADDVNFSKSEQRALLSLAEGSVASDVNLSATSLLVNTDSIMDLAL